MLQPLAAYGRVIGTDVTLQGLRYCAERKFPLLVACNGPQGCFLDASLDCITAFDALEHIEDDELALREIFRMLKPAARSSPRARPTSSSTRSRTASRTTCGATRSASWPARRARRASRSCRPATSTSGCSR
jgi:ubiquinone/menaquinone biosynthesis C-methylase UbiE